MHSHLIPQIDDGSKSHKDSVFMLSELAKLGYKKCIITPHIYKDYFPNTVSTISEGFEKLTKDGGLDEKLTLGFAAEYFADEHLDEKIDNGTKLLEISPGKVLVETSMISEMSNFKNLLFKLQTNSYIPVIAHPERYIYYESEFHRFEELKDMGCELQVNLLSLSGYYGKVQYQLGMELIRKGMVDYLGTDLHHPNQVENLKSILDSYKVMNLITAHEFKNSNL